MPALRHRCSQAFLIDLVDEFCAGCCLRADEACTVYLASCKLVVGIAALLWLVAVVVVVAGSFAAVDVSDDSDVG